MQYLRDEQTPFYRNMRMRGCDRSRRPFKSDGPRVLARIARTYALYPPETCTFSIDENHAWLSRMAQAQWLRTSCSMTPVAMAIST